MSSPPPGFERRHVVSVEDHLYHTAEMLEAMARACPALLAWTTVCTIDDPGPDTAAADRRLAAAFRRRPDRGPRRSRRPSRREHAARLFAIDARPARRALRRSRGWWRRCCCRAACWCRTFISPRCASFPPTAGGSRSTSPPRCAACSPASAGGPLRLEQARLRRDLRPRPDGRGVRSARGDGQGGARAGDRPVDRRATSTSAFRSS